MECVGATRERGAALSDEGQIPDLMLQVFRARGYTWRPCDGGLEYLRPDGSVALTVKDHRPEKINVAREQCERIFGLAQAEAR